MILKPGIDQGQSIHAILVNHPEIDLCEKTIYNYLADGFIFITPEYNHGLTAMKNYFDLLYTEFNNKAAGIVSYGSSMGARAGEQVRNILAELQVADVRQQVSLSLFADFEGFVNFKPQAIQEGGVNILLDQLNSWTNALKGTR